MFSASKVGPTNMVEDINPFPISLQVAFACIVQGLCKERIIVRS
jgi:hypothetical protein